MENYSMECIKKNDKKTQKQWILNESCWFGNKKTCIKDFKEVTRNGDEIFIKTQSCAQLSARIENKMNANDSYGRGTHHEC